MAVMKCKMCGGDLILTEGQSVAECEYCGTKQTLPKLNDDRRANLYDRANHFRRSNEFDKAMGMYERILSEDTTDAEAYWSLVLCRYGIEYVEDPATHKRLPTVNRAQYTSIFDDDNYKSALQYADSYQRHIYEEEAKAINEIQKGILAISQKEEPFDVFICYKETDRNGRRTPDSVLANDLYHQLTQEGFKVFFSRITLEDKLGVAYEPYIFAALNSARVMVVVGTKPEYFNAVWVKNEWSRYLSLIKNGAKKILIPAYRDMDPYDLPEEFSHLQAQDMGKLGFMQDLIRGIKKLAKTEEPKVAVVKETVIAGTAANTAPLLKRAFMFLEDEDWDSADEYCEKVLDIDPECARAYLGKLMAELQVCKQEDLRDQEEPFDEYNNYLKAIRFADATLKEELKGYISYINDRNEQERLENAYYYAKRSMENAKTAEKIKEAARSFEAISEYKDSAALARECFTKAKAMKKDEVLAEAKSKMTGDDISNYESAISILGTIPGWKDADESIVFCKEKIQELKAKREAEKLERKRQEEIARQEAAEKAKRNKKIAIIASSIVGVVAAVVLMVMLVIIPSGKYKDAMALFNAGRYEEAIVAFEAMAGYKDSIQKIEDCELAILEEQYSEAVALMEAGQYKEAIAAFEAMNGYKESTSQIEACKIAILDGRYADAIALMEAGQYEEAIASFEALNDYKNSNIKIQECNTAIQDEMYNNAVTLLETGKYAEAYEMFTGLSDYKNSAQLASQAYNHYFTETYKDVKVGDHIFFGAYEQDNITSNGKEEIEWIVLEVTNGRALLISNYVLDVKPYEDDYGTMADYYWQRCSLRKWLSDTFINDAFSIDEQTKIPFVTVPVAKHPDYRSAEGKETQDKVFLLSHDDLARYFDSDGALQCSPTKYAKAVGSLTKDPCNWWIRTHTDFYNSCAVVIGKNIVNDWTAQYDEGVRPAIWIDLNA